MSATSPTRTWRKGLLKGLFIAGWLAILVIPASVLIFQDALFNETATRHYASLTEASGRIEQGWIPPFLPESVKDVHEKCNIDYNTVILRFAFAPPDFPARFPPMDLVDGEQMIRACPRWIVWRSNWIPKEIKNGRADKLVSEGFEMYRVKETIRQQGWYLLVHPGKGMAYCWNSNAG